MKLYNVPSSVCRPQQADQDEYHIRPVYAEPVQIDGAHARDSDTPLFHNKCVGPLPAIGCEWAVGYSRKICTIYHQVEQEGRSEHPLSAEAAIQGYATMPKLVL
ncbi:hypothetical protein M9H77_07918 [Catharanthus roseus]|uniref:Uncharacterized protein n=1 Tax=Catharanthus roseus TaxID=4058 RepID=A0ACC0BWL4_CATRO|nr:hypothetical protein M9H77_07918 [Catharanthus roseus]